MLVHLRIASPPDLTDAVVRLLDTDERVAAVAVQPGAVLRPAGDLVTAEVAREAASDVLGRVKATGVDDRGLISVLYVDASPSAAAERCATAAKGSPDDAVIWDLVLERARGATRVTVSFLAFLLIATALAAIAVITDSPVLVVGAMVVGPEFAVVASVCCGLAFDDLRLAGRALAVLVGSFAAAILVMAVVGAVTMRLGLFEAAQVTAPRPLTGFIWHPDRWSVLVALLAGAAGVLALTMGRSEVMVGVFISVTTVPAAGNLALALGVWDAAEMRGSGLQLLLNLTCMIVVGTLVLVVERAAWARIGRMGRSTGHAVR